MTARDKAGAGIRIGAVWTIVALIWTIVGNLQQLEQLKNDMPKIVEALLSLIGGVFLSIICLVVYAVLWLIERRTPPVQMTLVGKFFHTFRSGDTTWQYQGRVLREENGRLFVQLYEVVAGMASTQQFLTDEQAASARFYDSEEEWREAGERMNRQSMPRR
ncbi:MAG: hypothetical protein HYX77_07895 [Acidobacteria bacterium]|nr:hypothetical protein [Acidobacteriota bacterium]